MQQARGKRISVRFRNIIIIMFVLVFLVMAAVMTAAFAAIINKLSSEFAGRYGASSAEALSAYIGKEIGFISIAARSNAVMDWLLDEGDDGKKELALDKMESIVGELYSFNLYVGVDGTHNAYNVARDVTPDRFLPFDKLDRGDPDDAWYFECVGSDRDYLLSVGIDHIMQRKRVWLDYKVACEGAPIGVFSTGLEFSHIAGELFSKYEDGNMRGLVIDNDGMVLMDSSLMHNKDFLYHEFDVGVDDEFDDALLLGAIWSRLEGFEGYHSEIGEPSADRLPSGPYRFVTVAPIRNTDWSVVILSGTPLIFEWSLFLPVTLTILALMVAFALSTSAVNYRLIFSPLGKLDRSLAMLKTNDKTSIYGTERDDEFGELSKTIQDLFAKANIDALTEIYNRRFMENNLVHIMEFLSRSNGLLSVLLIDVDCFKKYNDTYGHDQGDVCLKRVAGVLADGVTRTSDFAARFGGEEFVAILPNTDDVGARVVAQKLLDNVRALEIPHSANGVAPYVTISIGITTGRVAYMQTWEDYLKRADKALYMSKGNGKNQFTYLPLPDKAI